MLKNVLVLVAIAVSSLSYGQNSPIDRKYDMIIQKETAKLEYQLGIISEYEFDFRYTYLGWKREIKSSLGNINTIMYSIKPKNGEYKVVVVGYTNGVRESITESF